MTKGKDVQPNMNAHFAFGSALGCQVKARSFDSAMPWSLKFSPQQIACHPRK